MIIIFPNSVIIIVVNQFGQQAFLNTITVFGNKPSFWEFIYGIWQFQNLSPIQRSLYSPVDVDKVREIAFTMIDMAMLGYASTAKTIFEWKFIDKKISNVDKGVALLSIAAPAISKITKIKPFLKYAPNDVFEPSIFALKHNLIHLRNGRFYEDALGSAIIFMFDTRDKIAPYYNSLAPIVQFGADKLNIVNTHYSVGNDAVNLIHNFYMGE